MSDKGTVFIVDDDQHARLSLGDLVESMGLKPVCFASAEAFLQVHTANPPSCLVTDVRMPGMSGIALQERLNTLNVILPVIVISAHATTQTTVKSIQEGAVTFLEKTDSPQQLCDAITLALIRSNELHLENSQRNAIRKKMAGLNDLERQVLKLIAKGTLNKQVAKTLDVSMRTVEKRRQRIMEKLDVDSFAELMRIVVAAEDNRDDSTQR